MESSVLVVGRLLLLPSSQPRCATCTDVVRPHTIRVADIAVVAAVLSRTPLMPDALLRVVWVGTMAVVDGRDADNVSRMLPYAG